MRYAQLHNGTVVLVIDADTDPDAELGEWVPCGGAGPGFTTVDGVVFLPPAVVLPAWHWCIDIGPFFDRFGASKMAVLTSTDAVVAAIVRDVSVRKWVNLKLPEVAQSLAYVGTKVLTVTPAMQAAIINTVPGPEENLALRKLYFS